MRFVRKSRYAPYWRFFCILFAAGCAAGIAFTLGAWRFRRQDVDSLRLLTLQNFAKDSIDRRVYFQYLLARRMAPAAAGVLLGITALGTAYAVAASLGYGFLIGTFLSMSLLQNGAGGLFFFLAALLPQCFLYAPAQLLFWSVVYEESERVRMNGGLLRRSVWSYSLWSALCVLLLLWGVLLEAYVNPAFLAFML